MTHIITGYYGSGKTEFVLNLACEFAKTCNSNESITIADLDIINPFFRSRECAKELAPLNIEVMGSIYENHVAQDIPALSFAFLSKIRSKQKVIIDLAGGENGLKLLTSCYDSITSHEFLCVFNLYRPETDTAKKMVDFCKQINIASRLPITGLVNNGNLLAYTKPYHVLDSQKAVVEASLELGIPLKYTLVQEGIYKQIAQKITSERVLTFSHPLMRKNWQS